MLAPNIAFEWGTDARERAAPFGCDRELTHPDAELWRGVSVAAPPAVVFRRLCQLRIAPYSYDWIDNFGRRSPPRLTPGLERLAVGQRVMTIFRLVSFDSDRELTLRLMGRSRAVFGELAVSYRVVAQAPRRCRLLVKLSVRYPRSPLGTLARLVLPWGDLLMMRRQLLNLKRLAEQDAAHP